MIGDKPSVYVSRTLNFCPLKVSALVD